MQKAKAYTFVNYIMAFLTGYLVSETMGAAFYCTISGNKAECSTYKQKTKGRGTREKNGIEMRNVNLLKLVRGCAVCSVQYSVYRVQAQWLN